MPGHVLKVNVDVACTCPKSMGKSIAPAAGWTKNNEWRYICPDCGRSLRVRVIRERTGITKLRLRKGGCS